MNEFLGCERGNNKNEFLNWSKGGNLETEKLKEYEL